MRIEIFCTKRRYLPPQFLLAFPSRQSSGEASLRASFLGRTYIGDGMIRVTGAVLVLLAAVVAADAQGVGYGPGVNPSNPSDLTYRSNPQDLTVPGGSNRQDLVRRPAGVSSVVTSPARTTTRRYKTAKSKPKKHQHR